MVFGLALAGVGVALVFWLIAFAIAVLVAGLIATFKSEGAAAVPFFGCAAGTLFTYGMLGAGRGFYSPEILHWVPLFPSLGFAIGFLLLWPWPRAVGLAVGGCLVFLQAGGAATGILILFMIGSLFAGLVPALCTVIIVATVAISYWARAEPWLQARDEAERTAQQQLPVEEQSWTVDSLTGLLVRDGQSGDTLIVSPEKHGFYLSVYDQDETLRHEFGPFPTDAAAMEAGSALVAGTASIAEIHAATGRHSKGAGSPSDEAPLYWTAPDWLKSEFPPFSIEVEDAVLRRNPHLHTALWEIDQALKAGPSAGISPADFYRAAESLIDEFEHALTVFAARGVTSSAGGAG